MLLNSIKYFKVVVVTLLLLLPHCLHSQNFRAIDNKGTLKNIRNNRVFLQSDSPAEPIQEGDVWIEIDNTNTNKRVSKIYDGTKWIKIINEDYLFSTPIHRTSGNTTLTDSHHTIVVTNSNHEITLPNNCNCEGRIYRIKNVTDSDAQINGTTLYFDDEDSEDYFPKEELTIIRYNGTKWVKIDYSI